MRSVQWLLSSLLTLVLFSALSPAQSIHVIDNGGQVYNVKAYGATGNGTTDDTAAIQKAINAACVGGGVLYFPPGDFIVSSALNVCNVNGPGVSLEGAGAGVSTINFGNSISGGVTIGYSVPAYRAFISNISINSSNASVTALTLGAGPSAGAEGFSARNIIVLASGTALAFGANTFATSIWSSAIEGNVEIQTPSTSGENISFYGDVFSHYSSTAATLTISPASGTLQTNFFGDSFDGVQVLVANAQAAFYGGHWEDTATSSSPYFLVAGNGTAPTEVTISGGTMNNDSKYAAGAFFHVEAQAQLSVIGGFQPCNNIAFFTVINADAGSTAYLDDMQVPNCGGYPAHPLALTGAGTLLQGQSFPINDGVAPAFGLPIYLTGGISFSSGSGAPSGACQSGSLYVNSAGASGSTLYACVSSAWTNVK